MIDRIVEQDGVVRAWWGPGEGGLAGVGRCRKACGYSGRVSVAGAVCCGWRGHETPPHPPRRVFVSASYEAGGEGKSADQTNSAGPGSWTNSSSLL